MDFISAFIFGLQNSACFLQDKKAREDWLKRRKITKGYGFWSMEFPLLTNFLTKFGIHLESPEVNTAWDEIKDLCLEMLQKIETSSENRLKPSQDGKGGIWTKPVVYDQLLNQLSGSIDKISLSPLSTLKFD